MEPIHQFLGDRETFPILGDDPRDGTRRKVFSASPIPLQGPPTGYLYIVLGGEEYDSVVDMLQRSYILSLSVWAALAAFLVALLAGLVLFSMLTRRLSQLAAAMESFSASDFAAPVLLDQPPSMPDRPRDEIEQLRITFNRMVQRILDQVASLQQTDTLRRELVANVSHDLRTPLPRCTAISRHC